MGREFPKPPTCLGCPAFSLGISYTTPKGPRNARIATIGQGPGEEEARLGKPFVGKSGYLLDRWYRLAGVDPKEVYTDNVVRCRLVITDKDGVPVPSKYGGLQNRTPTMKEMRYCWGEDLKKVKPSVVFACGIPASTMLLGRKGRVGMIGNVFEGEL
jgi:DNA polymerase